MEDLQSALQSILSDPEQMNRVAALAESLGLKPLPAAPIADPSSPSFSGHSERGEESVSPAPQSAGASPGLLNGLDLPRLMDQLSAMSGTEDRVMGALRPSLSPEGRKKVDRALRAAKLSRLAGQFLSRGREGHV